MNKKRALKQVIKYFKYHLTQKYMETISISIEDMMKLGISWSEYAEMCDKNPYALRQGLPKDTMVDLPIEMVATALKNYSPTPLSKEVTI